MKEYVFGQTKRVEDFNEPNLKSSSKENEAASKALRKREYFHILEPLIVQDQNFFSEPQVQPILFEEVLINSKCPEPKVATFTFTLVKHSKEFCIKCPSPHYLCPWLSSQCFRYENLSE